MKISYFNHDNVELDSDVRYRTKEILLLLLRLLPSFWCGTMYDILYNAAVLLGKDHSCTGISFFISQTSRDIGVKGF